MRLPANIAPNERLRLIGVFRQFAGLGSSLFQKLG